MMTIIRIYLLAGLVAHKLLWELLRRRSGPSAATVAAEAPQLRVTAVKALKLTILALILIQTILPHDFLPISNRPNWLRGAGVGLYTLGLLVAVLGRLQLGNNWSDIEVGRVKEGHQTVDWGVYALMRHPIYVGDLLLLFGLELALNSWLVVCVVVLTPFVLRRAIAEEAVLAQTIPGYGDYIRRTKRFIPFVV